MKQITEGTGNTLNNVIKALLIGFIAGIIIGLTGKNWDFSIHTVRYVTASFSYKVNDYGNYGIVQAIITWIIVSALLFLRYNKKTHKTSSE